jgi:CHASE3 domain sensor protein
MSDNIDELIKEIAVKHGIAVSRDDPILILQTINNRLMQDSEKAQQAMLDHYKEEMEGTAMRWGNDAKDKAERILNASLQAGKDAMGEIIQGSAKATASAMRKELDESLKTVANSLNATRTIAILNVLASCITMLAAAVVLWAVIR